MRSWNRNNNEIWLGLDAANFQQLACSGRSALSSPGLQDGQRASCSNRKLQQLCSQGQVLRVHSSGRAIWRQSRCLQQCMSALLRVGTDAVQESASSRCSDMAGILLIIPINCWQPTSAWSTRRHEGIPDSNSPTRSDRAVSFAPSQECALCPRAWPSVFSPG